MRPRVHFTADGWINDPHALTWVDGVWHAFFQYVPGAIEWDVGCSWGHAVGPDLLSLREVAPALSPGDGDAGVWSGSLERDAAGRPTIFYTSVTAETPARGVVRTATPLDDGWIAWRKGEVVAMAAADAIVFRDPAVRRVGDTWSMIVGAGVDGGSAAVLGFASDDGAHWRPDGVVAARSSTEREPLWTGSVWECPQVIEVDGREVLIVSVWHDDVLHDAVWALGERVDGRFVAASWGRLGHGPSPYAATTFADVDGAPCAMFWLRGVRGDGWAGAHSVPYRLAVRDGAVSLTPHPDVDRHHESAGPGPFAADDALDIAWDPQDDGTLEVALEDGTAVEVSVSGSTLRIAVDGEEWGMPRLGPIRVLIDAPVLEVCGGAGVFACPIPAMAVASVSGDDVHARRLRRAAAS